MNRVGRSGRMTDQGSTNGTSRMNTQWRIVRARAVGHSLAAALLLAAASVDVAADCAEWGWKPGTGLPGVDSGCVWDIASWDPDGPAGPDPELLVVGGDFNVAGDVIASYIAAWDGEEWLPVGGGTNGKVFALTVYDGELVVGGEFTSAGGVPCHYIAAWDGEQWKPLAGGMNNWVWTLGVYAGELIAGGDFATAGGVPCQRIARWDGVQWQPLGTGMNDRLKALTVYHDTLVAGAWFSMAGGDADCQFIAQWDGSQWHAVGEVSVRDHHATLRDPLDDDDLEPAIGGLGQADRRRAGGHSDPGPVPAPRGGDHNYRQELPTQKQTDRHGSGLQESRKVRQACRKAGRWRIQEPTALVGFNPPAGGRF